MALIVYNKENSRPQQVVYQGKRTINMDSKGAVYLSKTMSIELGILGGGRVNFAHDEDTGEWYICHTTDKDGFTVWKDKRCARFSAGFIVRRIMLQAKVERKTVQFMIFSYLPKFKYSILKVLCCIVLWYPDLQILYHIIVCRLL
jgi:hypothetical protein